MSGFVDRKRQTHWSGERREAPRVDVRSALALYLLPEGLDVDDEIHRGDIGRLCRRTNQVRIQQGHARRKLTQLSEP